MKEIAIGCFAGLLLSAVLLVLVNAQPQQPSPDAALLARIAELEARPVPQPPQPVYEDLAGLDAETQRLLAENARISEDFEQQLRDHEWNIAMLNLRSFGRRVIFTRPTGRTGDIGELPGEAGPLGDHFGAEMPPEAGSEGNETP